MNKVQRIKIHGVFRLHSHISSSFDATEKETLKCTSALARERTEGALIIYKQTLHKMRAHILLAPSRRLATKLQIFTSFVLGYLSCYFLDCELHFLRLINVNPNDVWAIDYHVLFAYQSLHSVPAGHCLHSVLFSWQFCFYVGIEMSRVLYKSTSGLF